MPANTNRAGIRGAAKKGKGKGGRSSTVPLSARVQSREAAQSSQKGNTYVWRRAVSAAHNSRNNKLNGKEYQMSEQSGNVQMCLAGNGVANHAQRLVRTTEEFNNTQSDDKQLSKKVVKEVVNTYLENVKSDIVVKKQCARVRFIGTLGAKRRHYTEGGTRKEKVRIALHKTPLTGQVRKANKTAAKKSKPRKGKK